MKNLMKVAFVALFALCSTTLFAQKFGRINYQELIMSMPETDSMTRKMELLTKDYEEQLESMQVELNNKINDFQKASPTMSESLKQLKQRDIQDLNQRYQEFYQVAQEDLSNKNEEFMAPVEAKARAAISKVCKSLGLIVAFQTSSLVYIDEEQTTDILPAVKKELGIAQAAASPVK